MENKKNPFVVNLPAGDHYICRCGKSSNMPFCDGSHRGTEFTPKLETVTEEKKVAICACGKSENGIYCDGSHKKTNE